MSTASVTQTAATEFAIGFREMLVEQLEKEMEKTVKVLAAVPDAKRSWRPDPKARTAAELSVHLAGVDVDFLEGIVSGNFETMQANMRAEAQRGLPESSAELAKWYRKNLSAGLEKARRMTPQQLTRPIGFLGVYNLPAFAYLQFLNNHSIHHRGELVTYLRPMGSKVPSIYGPSADDSGGM